jgi:hypothetical protein
MLLPITQLTETNPRRTRQRPGRTAAGGWSCLWRMVQVSGLRHERCACLLEHASSVYTRAEPAAPSCPNTRSCLHSPPLQHRSASVASAFINITMRDANITCRTLDAVRATCCLSPHPRPTWFLLMNETGPQFQRRRGRGGERIVRNVQMSVSPCADPALSM